MFIYFSHCEHNKENIIMVHRINNAQEWNVVLTFKENSLINNFNEFTEIIDNR
jgi:hypothetical protein